MKRPMPLHSTLVVSILFALSQTEWSWWTSSVVLWKNSIACLSKGAPEWPSLTVDNTLLVQSKRRTLMWSTSTPLNALAIYRLKVMARSTSSLGSMTTLASRLVMESEIAISMSSLFLRKLARELKKISSLSKLTLQECAWSLTESLLVSQ